MKLVMERYPDRARLAMAALDRVRAGQHNIAPAPYAGGSLEASATAGSKAVSRDTVSAGSLVLYRPPGDQRTYACRVESVEGSRAYLIPNSRPAPAGWNSQTSHTGQSSKATHSVTTIMKGKLASNEGLGAGVLPADAWTVAALARSVPARNYFNLTDGDDMIHDEEGIEASSIQAAVVSAMEAVEELRAQTPASSDEWRGWQLEIVDASGRALQVIPLDALWAH